MASTLALLLAALAAAAAAAGGLSGDAAAVGSAEVAGENFETRLTLTTSMAPQRAHPMGDPRGGGGGGFINQHMKLLTMLTLAIHLRVASVILPPATSRDTFEVFEPRWQPETAASLWDVPSITQLLARYNITAVLATADRPPVGSLMLPTYFCRVLDIDFVRAEVHAMIHMYLAKLAVKPEGVTAITIYAPDLILALRTEGLPLYAEVARAVKFSPALTTIADGITSRLLSESSHFNGLHLRVEGDMREVHNQTIAGGLASYYHFMRSLNYTNSPLYIASGIFIEGGRVDTDRYAEVDVWLRDRIVGENIATRIVNRRLLVREGDSSVVDAAKALHSEQRAAIDFLVLLRAGKIIGSRLSSFSFMLREFRALAGLDRGSSGIVGDAWGLFQVAAGFAVP